MEKQVLIWFISISLITQLLGLYIGSQYIPLIKSGEIAPIVEQPESPFSSIIIFVYVLLGTGLVLLIVRFRKSLIRVLEAFSIFFSSWIAFDVIFPFGIFAAIALTSWKIFKPSILSKNLAVIFSVAGAGAFIGASLGILPVLIFVLILSIYDFVSVFITKHMVYMAKAIIETQSAFTVSVPYKFKKPVTFKVGGKRIKKGFHVFQLGAGDILIPLMFAVSVLSRYTILHSIFTILGSLAALGGLLYFVTKKPGKALPALPMISTGMLVGFIISLFFLQNFYFTLC
jgi:presenilin-like A22 family membrane protease